MSFEFSSQTTSIVARACCLLALCTWHPFAVAAHESEAFPAVQLVDRIERYPITGASIYRINSELKAHAESERGPGNGSTRSEIELTTRLDLHDDACRISTLVVHLRVTTLLPEWIPAGRPSQHVREEWTKSAANLTRHEAGHQTHAIEAAEALRQALIDIAPKEDCLRLDMAIGIELQSAMQRLDNRELRYDKRTRGGLREEPVERKGAGL